MKLVLFIAGRSPNSIAALINLRKQFDSREKADAAFEVVDVFEQPERALAGRVFLTPTLLWEDHTSRQRLVGDLGSLAEVSAFLEAGLA